MAPPFAPNKLNEVLISHRKVEQINSHVEFVHFFARAIPQLLNSSQGPFSKHNSLFFLFSQEQIRHHFPKGNSAGKLMNIIPSSSPMPAADPSGMRKSASSVSTLFGSSPQTAHHFPAIPETEDQGLTMSAGASKTLPKQIEAAAKPFPSTETANYKSVSQFNS